MPFKITCLTPAAHIPSVLENLREIGEVAYFPDAGYAEAIEASTGADAVFVNPNRMDYRIDKFFLEKTGVKHVCTASTGTNHIDFVPGVQVYSLTKRLDVTEKISSTAEHALGLTLALVRYIPTGFDAVKQGRWDCSAFVGRQISEMTAGVIGYGRLGKMYARYMAALGAETCYHDPYVSGGVDLDELIARSDIISLHVHLTDETRKMVNMAFLDKMKGRPRYLVNTSRGDVVCEGSVAVALWNRDLAGYAADVLSTEQRWNPTDNVLVRAAKSGMNVILTPHVGGATLDGQKIAYNAAVGMLKSGLERSSYETRAKDQGGAD